MAASTITRTTFTDGVTAWNASQVNSSIYDKIDQMFGGAGTYATLELGGALKINGALTQLTNDGGALGTSSLGWSDLFLASGAVVNFNNGNMVLTHASGILTLDGSGAGTLEVKGAILPTVSNTPALGSTTRMWADLFLGSGGVINFDNGDVTITHSTNTLTFAGASSGYVFNDGVLTVSGFGTHSFSAGGTGENKLLIRNTTAGTGNYARLDLQADGSDTRLVLDALSSTYTTSGIFVQAGAVVQSQGVGGLSIAANNASGAIRFYTGGQTERASILANGTIKTSSTVSVGNATPSTSGAGITFPASQSASSDANTLDDYEEGTWTPTISGSTTAGTGTYSVQVGRYTKIGNRVWVDARISWSAHTGTGNLYITGLTFASANISNYRAVASLYPVNIALTAGYVAIGYMEENQQRIYVDQVPTGGGAGIAVPMDTDGTLLFSISYEVA